MSVFKDKSLSNKALGMLCRMLSLPDGWNFSVMGLVGLSSDGKSAVMKQLDELEEHGYLIRRQIRENGKMAGVEYIVSETKMTDKPYADFRHTEKPHTVDQTQSITNISNTDLSTTKELINTEFENLWSVYPKKQGKSVALKAYEKAKKSGTTAEEVLKGIEAYKDYINANNIPLQYVKMGSTFFSQKSWQDDWSMRLQGSGNPFLDMLGTEVFE